MFRNYFKTTIRNLSRNKVFSLINILGLSLGMACSLLIFLWVHDETGMDGFHRDKNIYTVYETVFSQGKPQPDYYTAGLLATELKKKMPEIKYASGFDEQQAATFEQGDKIMNMDGAAADSDFFKIFSYPLLQGNAEEALNAPDKVAISRRMAVDFFGSPEAAINKNIRYNNGTNLRVAAVFENIPSNSSDQFDYLLNWPQHLKEVDWLTNFVYRRPKSYISLYPQAQPGRLNAKVKNFLDGYLSKFREGAGLHYELGLIRFDKMYLNSNFKNGVPDGGRIEYVHLFTIVAFFILIIACINFMNLSTARSVKRAKEVGVRKAIGALRSWLIIQFIGEAFFYTLLAAVAAVLLVMALLPAFNAITNKQIIMPFSAPAFWLSLIGLVAVIGLVAGSYPALFLSSLNPVKVLKGTLKFSLSAIWFRKGLVIFQFTLSVILIIGTMVVSRQLNFMQTRDLGFDKNNLIYVPVQGDLGAHYVVFKQELSGRAGIGDINRADQMPTSINAHGYDSDWDGKDPSLRTVIIHTTVGYDFVRFMHLELLKGRDFSRDFPTDSLAYVINETALKMTGYKDPIGKRLSTFGNTNGKIIGLLKDFHFKSLHDPIQPLVINLNEHTRWGYILVRAKPGQTAQALTSIEKVYKALEPKFPFNYSFSDAEYLRLYKSEQVVGKLSDAFSFFAIFISCLGLLGLSIFTAEQRTKEIGVRKVLGASELRIFSILSKDFLQLVALAFLIAAPIAWLVMNNWLQDYAYRTDIGWDVFALAGLLTLFIALGTISFQAIKAALANPVKSLRTE